MLISRIADLLMPCECPVCGAPADAGGALCAGCLLEMPRLPLYDRAESAELAILANAVCPPSFIAAWMLYDPFRPHAEMIRTSKYRGRPGLARRLGALFAAEFADTYPEAAARPDVLIPVPMYWRKELTRGYNQAVCIAHGIGNVLGVPVADNLVAVRPHATQTRRSAQQRRANIEGIFSVLHPSDFDGLDVVIVDDVITTGATIGEVAIALGRAGARPASVGAMALGMAGSER